MRRPNRITTTLLSLLVAAGFAFECARKDNDPEFASVDSLYGTNPSSFLRSWEGEHGDQSGGDLPPDVFESMAKQYFRQNVNRVRTGDPNAFYPKSGEIEFTDHGFDGSHYLAKMVHRRGENDWDTYFLRLKGDFSTIDFD